ncbi:hypothetical protein PGB90_005199 [Kerria lacca]
MKKSKINKKACTVCGLEAAVARKVCSGCNTPFYSKRPTYFYETKESAEATKAESTFATSTNLPSTSTCNNSQVNLNATEDSSRRRTERVKREKPHFYDASEFQNKSKKKKNDKNNIKTNKQSKTQAAQLRKKEKKRLKELKLRESLAETEDENIYESIMTERKAEQLAIILQELNNKLSLSAWRP